MKEFFLPSGESFLPGDYENLLKTMQRADGELCEPGKFRCVMYFPEWNKVVRSKGVRISFIMQCKCVESKGGYRITYRTLPGMSAVFLYVTCVLLCIIGLATLSGGLQPSVFVGPVVSIFFFLYSLYARKKCIRRFLALFPGKS